MIQDLNMSYVYDQAMAYKAMGHSVKILIPIGFGKKDFQAKRISPILTRENSDGIERIYLRYITLSRFGRRWFNTPSVLFSTQINIKPILKDFSPDIIHAHTIGLCSALGYFLKKYINCPLVVTTHGSDTSIPYEFGKLELLRSMYDQADCIVAVSTKLENKVKLTGTRKMTTTILNGFDMCPTENDYTKIPFSFIHVSNLIPQKNVDKTIIAFSKIHKIYPEATLRIAGAGPCRNELEQLADSLGIADRVTFLGRISVQEVLNNLREIQFFVMPSVREGFGIVYLEAMASSCITIGSQGEGISDLIIPGKNGFLISPNEPDSIVEVVKWCVKNPDKIDDIIQNAKVDVQELTWEKNVMRYSKLFNDLLSNNRL